VPRLGGYGTLAITLLPRISQTSFLDDGRRLNTPCRRPVFFERKNTGEKAHASEPPLATKNGRRRRGGVTWRRWRHLFLSTVRSLGLPLGVAFTISFNLPPDERVGWTRDVAHYTSAAPILYINMAGREHAHLQRVRSACSCYCACAPPVTFPSAMLEGWLGGGGGSHGHGRPWRHASFCTRPSGTTFHGLTLAPSGAVCSTSSALRLKKHLPQHRYHHTSLPFYNRGAWRAPPACHTKRLPVSYENSACRAVSRGDRGCRTLPLWASEHQQRGLRSGGGGGCENHGASSIWRRLCGSGGYISERIVADMATLAEKAASLRFINSGWLGNLRLFSVSANAKPRSPDALARRQSDGNVSSIFRCSASGRQWETWNGCHTGGKRRRRKVSRRRARFMPAALP